MTLTAAVVAFTNSVLAVVTNFGVDLTPTQTGSIAVLVNAGIVLVTVAYAAVRKRNGKQTGAV